jgi:glucokinase
VVLLNDFVANGYGVIDLDDSSEIETLYKPPEETGSWKDDTVKVVLGIGTGLGACQLTRAPSKMNTEGVLVPGDYHVNSAEAGMKRLPIYVEEDRRFDDFL